MGGARIGCPCSQPKNTRKSHTFSAPLSVSSRQERRRRLAADQEREDRVKAEIERERRALALALALEQQAQMQVGSKHRAFLALCHRALRAP